MKKIQLFLDINETLIITGETTREQRKKELTQLEKFYKLCKEISLTSDSFEVIFMTGNSFEYCRRIEEPLGLKNIKNLSLSIVSENGLIGRSFKDGNIWNYKLTDEYKKLVYDFMLHMNDTFQGLFYTQGNEKRLTLKPVRDKFTRDEIKRISKTIDFYNLETVCSVYTHQYYIDIDPLEVVNGSDCIINFNGKYSATKTLIESAKNSFILSIGDSVSDIPMFEAIEEYGGTAYWVSNSDCVNKFPNATCLENSYTEGVNDVLANVLATLKSNNNQCL